MDFPNKRFFVYFNIEFLPAAWAAYRGHLVGPTTYGTDEFRPIAFWPFGLLKKAAGGDAHSVLRLEKEIAAEEVRRKFYPHQVSRLHGIYLWETEADAIRCEEKWRPKEGQHFDRDRLVEVGFTFSRHSRVDTQWIDEFIIDNTVPLDRTKLDWVHKYWAGEPRNENPHWEHLVEGRGMIWGTALRMKALKRIEEQLPNQMGQLEVARLAAEIGSNLNHISPFILSAGPNSVSVAFYTDTNDLTPDFFAKLHRHISSLDGSHINRMALAQLKDFPQSTPDLRSENFAFDLNALSEQGRAGFALLVSKKDRTSWGKPDRDSRY